MSVAARFFCFLPSDYHPKGTDKKNKHPMTLVIGCL